MSKHILIWWWHSWTFAGRKARNKGAVFRVCMWDAVGKPFCSCASPLWAPTKARWHRSVAKCRTSSRPLLGGSGLAAQRAGWRPTEIRPQRNISARFSAAQRCCFRTSAKWFSSHNQNSWLLFIHGDHLGCTLNSVCQLDTSNIASTFHFCFDRYWLHFIRTGEARDKMAWCRWTLSLDAWQKCYEWFHKSTPPPQLICMDHMTVSKFWGQVGADFGGKKWAGRGGGYVRVSTSLKKKASGLFLVHCWKPSGGFRKLPNAKMKKTFK